MFRNCFLLASIVLCLAQRKHFFLSAAFGVSDQFDSMSRLCMFRAVTAGGIAVFQQNLGRCLNFVPANYSDGTLRAHGSHSGINLNVTNPLNLS